jgi:3-oxoadipate enol-lactonase / 4-carboxymuconolactone decarboxylase
MGELAAGVVRASEEAGVSTFTYAGDSVGGAVGLQLMIDTPERVESAALICTGAKIGTSAGWAERATTVLQQGVESQLEGSRSRWFGSGFVEREPDVASALLRSLAATDKRGYAAVCLALAEFDVTDRLAEIEVPVLAIAGADDVPTPPGSLEIISRGVGNGEVVVLEAVGHLAPAEAPHEVAKLIWQRMG